ALGLGVDCAGGRPRRAEEVRRGGAKRPFIFPIRSAGLECLSMPDFFPCMHDLVKSSALSLARHVRHARQELTKAEGVLSKATGPAGWPPDDSEAQNRVEVKRAAVQRWEGVQSTYRDHLETISLTLHPFH